MQKHKKLLVLVILDGFGFSKNKIGNAIANAKMPFWNDAVKKYPFTLLKASAEAVGLPKSFIGNSEVGHLTIGAGRVIESILTRFNDEIANGLFFNNSAIKDKFTSLLNTHKSLHIIGLLSDAGVHSYTEHLYAFLEFAKTVGLKKIFVHAFLDGRDTPQFFAKKYLNDLDDFLQKLGAGKLASIQGRFFAMDRDKNWDRTKKAYELLANPKYKLSKDWQAVLEEEYSKKTSDEFIEPSRFIKNGFIEDGDGVVFLNFRADRARQLAESLIEPNFDKFLVDFRRPKLSFFISTIRYEDSFKNLNNYVLFDQPKIENTLLDVLAANHKKVFIIAETEKYAHVTYFFKGEREESTSNETRVLIPSLKVKNYIENPAMSAPRITEAVLNSLKTDPAEFYLINYANADMVGHSANYDATVAACECLDKQLKLLFDEVVKKQDGILVITADHGNAEELLDLQSGESRGMHTTNPVPFVFLSNDLQKINSDKLQFGLANIAPTMLNCMGLKIPNEIVKNLIINNMKDKI